MSIKKLEQSHIDLTKVAPLQANRLVAFINHLAIKVTQQLNDLTLTVDSRLYRINEKINMCNANLVVLETKLNSISGLRVGATSSAPATSPTKVVDGPPQSEAREEAKLTGTVQEPQANKPKLVDAESPNKQEAEASEASGDAEPAQDTTEIDEDMARFQKMLKLGVPIGAVHLKMTAEGFDPALLVAK